MPTKTRPRFFKGTRTSELYDSPGTSFPLALTSYPRSWSDTFTGVDLPRWRDIIASGGNATTAADGYSATYAHRPGATFVRWGTSPTVLRTAATTGYLCNLGDVPDPNSVDVSKADTQARLTFLKKYRKARTGFSGGVFLGELLETVRMLKRPAKSLREGISAYAIEARRRAKKYRGPPKKRNRIIQDAWLEYSFGWTPLISDVEDAYGLLGASPTSYREVISSTSSEDYIGYLSPSSIESGWVQQDRWRYRYAERHGCDVRYLGAVDCKFNKPPTFVEQLGFSPSNFFPTVWELIPYSFLVDYFTNIGDLIDGMSLGTVSLGWGCKTSRKRISRFISSFSQDTSSVPSGSLRSAHAIAPVTSCTGKRFTRSVLTSVSVGLSDFRFELPGVGSRKWLNIGALASLRRL